MPTRRLSRRSAPRPVAVLVVDDDEHVRECLSELLRLESCVVQTAANGRDALDQLRAERPRPDVVLCDLEMPQMDGRAFVLALKADPKLSEIPVVLISGAERVAAEADQLGVFGSLKKPTKAAALLEVMHEAAGLN